VVRKDDKGTDLDHMSEGRDGIIHCQDHAVVLPVLLLSGAELMGVESQCLPSVADTLLKGGADCNIRSVCK
jgi:hypothetical protein